MDISNILHSLQLPSKFTDLFALSPMGFRHLDEETKEEVVTLQEIKKFDEVDMGTPSMSMGFIYAVTLAHNATTNNILQHRQS